MSLSQTHQHRCAPGRRRRTRGRRGRRRRAHARQWRCAQGCGDRAAGHPGAGRLGARGIRPRRRARRYVEAIVEAIRALSPWFPHDAEYLAASAHDFERWADGGLRRAGLLRFARRLPAAGAPGRRHPSPRRVPDVHAERVDRPARRGADRRGDLAGVHRPARDGVRQPAVRLAAAGRLHPRLRHELGGAVPRDGGHARDPDVHVGRDLPGPRGGALPARRARGSRDHEARAARRGGADAGRPGARGEDLRDVGHHPRPHPHARRPAVRSVHDQAADAVLPLLAGGAAVRPHGVPRVRRDPEAPARARSTRARRSATPRRRCSSTPGSCSTP